MQTSTSAGGWIGTLREDGGGARLVCFPYAGGSAHVFTTWLPLLAPGVGLHAVQLPGRGRRMREPALERADAVVAGVVEAFQQLPPRPTVFLGYSMGALIAFETARWLRRIGVPGPVMLLAAAARPPQVEGAQRLAPGTDAELLARIRRLGGTPSAVLESRELLDLLLPPLRADFALIDDYLYRPGAPLDCPIVAVGGDADSAVDPALVAQWALQTAAGFTQHTIKGGHFFLDSARAELLAIVNGSLRGVPA